MKNYFKLLAGTTCLIGLLSGCTHLSSVSTTTIPAQRGEKVSTEAYRFIFLGFNFNNDYVNEMADSLARTCPKGKVEGILTKHESIVYFPLFAHAVRITSEGYCNSKTTSNNRSRKPRRS